LKEIDDKLESPTDDEEAEAGKRKSIQSVEIGINLLKVLL